jgi:hypothetical protein
MGCVPEPPAGWLADAGCCVGTPELRTILSILTLLQAIGSIP